MTIKINYLNKISDKSSVNLVLFSNETFNINSLKKYLSSSEFSYINDLLKTSDLKKNMFVFELNSKKRSIPFEIFCIDAMAAAAKMAWATETH